MTYDDLQDYVVYQCYCSWDIFMENVLDNGYDKEWLKKAVSECKDKKDLRKLVGEFI